MALTWPLTLPQSFLATTISEKGPNNIIRTSMESGPAKTRRRFTATTIPFEGSMIMTLAQYLIFKTFFRATINDGAIQFDMPDDINGGIMTVKFKEAYKATFLGTVWQVNFKLDIQP